MILSAHSACTSVGRQPKTSSLSRYSARSRGVSSWFTNLAFLLAAVSAMKLSGDESAMKMGVAEPRHGGAETRRLGNMGRMEKTIATVLHEAHRLQVEEAVEALEEGPEGFYESCLDRCQGSARIPTLSAPCPSG